MGNWWDTNNDGHLDAVEMDRFLLDNGLMPGQPDGYWHDVVYNDDDDNVDYPYDGDSSDSYDSDDFRESRSGYDAGDFDDYSYGVEADDDEGVVRDENRCYNCLFWRDDYEDWSRDCGCRIFYQYIDKRCSGMDGSSTPDEDEETCEEFRPKQGDTVSCFDCKHFTGVAEDLRERNFAQIFDAYCDIGDRVESIAADTMYKDYQGNITWTVICPRFAPVRQKRNAPSPPAQVPPLPPGFKRNAPNPPSL